MAKLDQRNQNNLDAGTNPGDLLWEENLAGRKRHDDGLDDHPITAGDASGVSGDLSGGAKNIDDNRNDALNREEANPMNSTVTGKKTGKLPVSLKLRLVRKGGPLGGIFLLLAAGGFGITGLLSPALLLNQITDMFTNNFNDAHPALSVRTNVLLAKKINNTKNSFAESKDGKCNIRCKMGTMSDGMKRNLDARGFEVKGEKKFGRWVVTSIKLPDEKGTVTNGADWKKAMKDPVLFSQFSRVYSSKTAYFLNTKFGTMLKTKLGLTKAHRLAGETKEKFNESFRKALNLPDKVAVDTPNPNASTAERLKNTRFSKAAPAIDGIGKGAASLTNLAATACLTYNGTRAISSVVKLAKYSAYAAVALTFFNAASKLKAGDAGGIDPAVMSELGNRLTATNVNTTDGSAGLSATDSYGYKAAMYGDNGPVPEYAKAHSMESSGLLGAMGSLVKFFTGMALARAMGTIICQAALNIVVGITASCLPSATGGAAFLGCAAIQTLISVAIGQAITAAMPLIIDWIVSTNVNLPDETTAGAQLGDVLYPGGAAILGGQAASYGMAPGNKDQIATYVAATKEIRERDEKVARLEAKQEPFNIYNQYSFLGSMVRNMNVAAYANTSFTNGANLLFSSLPKSLASLMPNANAGTYMPLVENKAEQYGKAECPETVDFSAETNSECCPSLQLIGAVGDAYCMPAFTKSTDEMNSDPDATLDFMINGGYISEDTGEPRTDTDQGKQFQRYLDNCPFRTEPWGETTKTLEGEPGQYHYEWYIGALCNKDTDTTPTTVVEASLIVMDKANLNPGLNAVFQTLKQSGMDEAKSKEVENDIKNFRNYAMDEPVNATLAGEDTVLKHSPLPAAPGETPVDPNAPTENSGNVNPDGWTFPTTAGAPLLSPFGPRGGGYHTGIDLGVPSGSPFYATRDGVVLTREFNIYSIAGGAWCPVTPSESPIQKDIWITHNVDGVTYTSVYAHMSQFLVGNGATVKAGDLIGYTGGSGCSSGPHVHFEIWQTGSPNPGVPSAAALNPWPLINP